MEKFYGNINSIKSEYLLKATPYCRDTTVNFDHNLDVETFFDHLYTPRSEESIFKSENDSFDNRIDYAMRDLENEYAKVSMIHIVGYAGCGKTTYIHNLLWKLKERKESVKSYSVIDYEGSLRAEEPLIECVCRLINNYDITSLLDYLDAVAKKQLFDITRFRNCILYLNNFSSGLYDLVSDSTVIYNNQTLKNYIEEFENIIGDDFLYFLFLLDLILLLYERFLSEDNDPMILVIDNTDSMSNLSEETKLLPVLKKFVNDCNYFFGSNLENTNVFHNNSIESICRQTKLLIIFTTRVVTFQRYEIIAPDWENINGWVSINLPEHYYNQKDVICNKINYYLYLEKNNEKSKAIKELRLLRKMAGIAYHNYTFMRLFNGNVRICIERFCAIINSYPNKLINEMLALYDYSNAIPEAVDGFNGFFLSLILHDFKNNNIYEQKLNLSPCRRDGTISLSRIILTILREKGDRCSILELFNLLIPLSFDSAEICKTVWNLCETGRSIWRRLVIFDLIVPRTLEDLLSQAALYKNEDFDIEKYSELVICTAGQTYMEVIVPHFEFMLSRHERGLEYLQSDRYQPLFSESSEKKVVISKGKELWRFEIKMDWVYEDVKDCCYNSFRFAETVMNTFHITKDEYIKSSFFNYHKVGWDGDVGSKQSYESRLIFSHIGYIERYRRYILKKNRNNGIQYLVDINKRIVDRIVNYITLYQDNSQCFQTDIQNSAASELLRLAKKIQGAYYADFDTKIQLND